MSDPAQIRALRKELIQVAAVAVAVVEDIDYGIADTRAPGNRWDQRALREAMAGESVLIDVQAERQRQDNKWGPQHHDLQAWMTILGEEFGEACRAILELLCGEE